MKQCSDCVFAAQMFLELSPWWCKALKTTTGDAISICKGKFHITHEQLYLRMKIDMERNDERAKVAQLDV